MKVSVIMNRSPGFLAGLRALGRLAVWGLVVGAASFGQACAASAHFVRGSVVAVDPTRLEIRHKTGQRVSIAITPATDYRWDHSPATLDDVRVGTRVMVVLDEPLTLFNARTVRIFTPSRPR